MFTGCKFTIFKNILRRLVDKNIFHAICFKTGYRLYRSRTQPIHIDL